MPTPSAADKPQLYKATSDLFLCGLCTECIDFSSSPSFLSTRKMSPSPSSSNPHRQRSQATPTSNLYVRNGAPRA